MTAQAFVVCPLIAAIALWRATSKLPAVEQRIMLASWVLHIGCAILTVLVTGSFGGGDMDWYALFGRAIARTVADDERYLVDVFKLIFAVEHDLPFSVLLEGTATGSMSGLTGLAMVFVGDSTYAVSIIFSMFAFWGMSCLHRAACPSLERHERVPFAIASMLVPSGVFWTSGIFKEAIVVGCFGSLCLGLVNVAVHRRRVSALRALAGGYGVALIKPYLLFPFVLAAGAWLYSRQERRVGLTYKLGAVALAVAGLVAITRAFPEYGIDRLGAGIARSQQGFALAGGGLGSAVALGDDEAPTTLLGQLKFAPLGVLNALARPLPFDVRNVSTAIASVEMTALVVVVLMLLRENALRTLVAKVTRRPPFMFSAVFVLTFGTAIGLATLNLGTLSRYRVPMIPFYVGMVLCLRAKRPAPVAAARRAPPRSALAAALLRRGPAERSSRPARPS